ncbi:MAG: SIMPL domain-containing protein [Acidaminococcaceae bacterium]|nr:SIMPL domain-containing protein [Acidaminococcaceae bacterium]
MKKVKALAAATLVAISLLSMQGAAAMAAEANTISVRGIAKQEVAPDMTYVTLGISVKADTAEAARDQAAEASQKVRRALLGLAISEGNIQSSSYNLYPDYENINGKSRQKGYALNTTLRIKVDDLKKLAMSSIKPFRKALLMSIRSTLP